MDGDDALSLDLAGRQSTATWAIWQPNVWTRMPSGFGPRDPVPTTCALPSLPVTSTSGSRARRRADGSAVDDVEVVGRDLEDVARELEQLVRTSYAAARTAGATDGIVCEPPVTGA